MPCRGDEQRARCRMHLPARCRAHGPSAARGASLLSGLVDDEGSITRWPSKQKQQVGGPPALTWCPSEIIRERSRLAHLYQLQPHSQGARLPDAAKGAGAAGLATRQAGGGGFCATADRLSGAGCAARDGNRVAQSPRRRAQSPTAQSPTAQSPTAQSPTAQSPTAARRRRRPQQRRRASTGSGGADVAAPRTIAAIFASAAVVAAAAVAAAAAAAVAATRHRRHDSRRLG